MWVIEQGDYIGQVETWDRGIQFGDGLFETININNGEAINLYAHVKRLSLGLSTLFIADSAFNQVENIKRIIEAHLVTLMAKSNLQDGIFKIIITRGNSARGYGFESALTPNVTAFYSSKPTYNDEIYAHGVDVKICQTQCSVQPQLAGLKHLNRLENVLAKQELKNVFEGLMLNYLGFVIEGTMSNVFFEREGALYTPELDVSGVKGVVRSRVFDVAKKYSMNVHIKNIDLTELNNFTGAFICNSVIGVVPIKRIEQQTFDVSQMTKKIQSLINGRGMNE